MYSEEFLSYLYYSELEAKHYWMIGPDYTKDSAWVHSQAGDALDASQVPAGSWAETAFSSWQLNSAMTVGCKPTGMHLAALHNTLLRFPAAPLRESVRPAGGQGCFNLVDPGFQSRSADLLIRSSF